MQSLAALAGFHLSLLASFCCMAAISSTAYPFPRPCSCVSSLLQALPESAAVDSDPL